MYIVTCIYLLNSWIINEGNTIEIISVEDICKSDTESSSFAFNFNLDFLGQTVSYHPNYSKTSTYTSLDSISQIQYSSPNCMVITMEYHTVRPLILYLLHTMYIYIVHVLCRHEIPKERNFKVFPSFTWNHNLNDTAINHLFHTRKFFKNIGRQIIMLI